jgi:hypothetical protein
MQNQDVAARHTLGDRRMAGKRALVATFGSVSG